MKRAWCYLFHWKRQRRFVGLKRYGWHCDKCGQEWIVEDWRS
jgi:hypothetical protein